MDNYSTLQPTTTREKLTILVIAPTPKIITQLTHSGIYSAHSTLATTVDDAIAALHDQIPQLIITEIEYDEILSFSHKLTMNLENGERPLLVCVTNTPDKELFEVADQIVAHSHLPYIDQIIDSLLRGTAKVKQAEQRCAKLEADNQKFHKEIVRLSKTSKELGLLKQAIVHSVGHELRTPMLQVKSAVALLKEDEGTNQTIIELAMGAITRLEGGIRNVTLLNELMSESLDRQSFMPVPIMQILEAALRNLGRSWEHRASASRVKVHVAPTATTVFCDRQRIIIALQLLLDNALKFSEGEVEINVTDADEFVILSVKDDGIGIPQDQIDLIFDAFYQVDSSSTRRYGGIGIGLAIVRLIMEQHETKVEVHSTERQGSSFTFALSAYDYMNSNNALST